MIRSLIHSAGRLLAGFLIIRGTWFLLAQWLQFATPWSLTALAVVGSIAAEIIYRLYRYERAAVETNRGRALLALRWALLAGVLWMLSQPVWSRMVTREILQEVVVLMDDSASMHLVDDGETATRQQRGQQALKDSGLLEALEGKIRVRTLRAARKVLDQDEQAIEGWDQSTDLAGALGTVLEQVPADQLCGVVLVSDGRHNRPARVEDVARRFGILDAPIGALAIGSEKPPRDAAILSVQSPDAVYLGDRIRVSAQLKLDGYRGKKTKVRLLQDGLVIEEKNISISQDRYREEIKFRHTPEQRGITSYRVEMDALPGERFNNNNSWTFQTAVTDARTNVLIVDSHPRWEFRYLRNLFYGRDKSIHLQYVLLNPDRVDSQEDTPVPASASRPFGSARATQLPTTEQEWRKFDVLILGDIPPEALSPAQWKVIQNCVQQRGALLVAVAGPRSMPHAHRDPALASLLPVQYDSSARTYFANGEEDGFRMTLTSEGKGHPVTAQSDSRLENEKIWSDFPRLHWRHPISRVKEGAQVLLMAQSKDRSQTLAPRSGKDMNAALHALARKKQEEEKNALLVVHQVGNGKVAMLLTDRTWRLREGVGDVHHHRFWGQLVRWGAGPNLRSGSSTLRLGTDHLSYSGDDRIQITARMRDGNLSPLKDASLKARVWKSGEIIATVPLPPVEDSQGLHQAMAGPFTGTGNYEITLEGEKVEQALKESGKNSVRSTFRVIGAKSPVELSETTLNRSLLETLADLSGGSVLTPDDAKNLPSLFLTGEETREELRETSLWDHALLLLLLLALLTAEWSLRRKAGLP